jgi:hypothetical protein
MSKVHFLSFFCKLNGNSAKKKSNASKNAPNCQKMRGKIGWEQEYSYFCGKIGL